MEGSGERGSVGPRYVRVPVPVLVLETEEELFDLAEALKRDVLEVAFLDLLLRRKRRIAPNSRFGQPV